MEFEEMKKIWDAQNKEPLYAINEEALHRRIRAKRRQASRLSNINDIGLIAVALATAVLVLVIGKASFYDYLSAIALVLISVYVLMGRIRRKKQENQFDRTMLGDLDHAIANISYETTRAKTFVWWYILPVAIPTLLNMMQAGVPAWKWLFVLFAFVLSYSVVQWSLKLKHLPRKGALEALREKLTKELQEDF